MSEPYFYEIVNRFIAEQGEALSEDERYILNVFQSFCHSKYRRMTMALFSEEMMDKFLLVWLPSNITKIQEGTLHCIPTSFHKLCDFIETQYHVVFTRKYTETTKELLRISDVNKAFSKFLNDPIISYSPMVIDFERYRRQKQKAEGITYESKEKGYFAVKDIFPNNALVLRKLVSGRYVKIVLDKDIINCVKVNDILYMSIKQNPYLSWEIEEVKKYFPSDSLQYIM